MNNLSMSNSMNAYQFETLDRVHKLIAENMLSDVDMRPRQADQGLQRNDDRERPREALRERAADGANAQRTTQNTTTARQQLPLAQTGAADKAQTAQTGEAAGRMADRSAGIAAMSQAPAGLPGTEQKQAMLSSSLATLSPPPTGGDKSGGMGMPFGSMGMTSKPATPAQAQMQTAQAQGTQAPTTPTPTQAPVTGAMQTAATDATGQATRAPTAQQGAQAPTAAAQGQSVDQQGFAALRSALAASSGPAATAMMNALAQAMAQGAEGQAAQLPGGATARQGAPTDGAMARQPQAAPTLANSETALRAQPTRAGDPAAAGGRASAATDPAGRSDVRNAATAAQQAGASSSITPADRAGAAAQAVFARTAAGAVDGQGSATANQALTANNQAAGEGGDAAIANRAQQSTGRETTAQGLAYGTTAAGTPRVADDVAMVRASASPAASSLAGAMGADGMRDPLGRVPAEGLLNTLVAGDAPSRAFAASVALNAAMIPGWPAPPPLEGVVKKGKMGVEKAQEAAPVDPEEMAAHIAKFAAAKAAMRAFLDEMKVDPKKKQGLLSFLSGFVSCFTEAMEAAKDASAFFGGAEDAGGRPSRGRLKL